MEVELHFLELLVEIIPGEVVLAQPEGVQHDLPLFLGLCGGKRGGKGDWVSLLGKVLVYLIIKIVIL